MSELALELIAREKQQKTGRLDLGRCGLQDTGSGVGKALKMLRKGRDCGVRLAEMYNTVAANIPGIPSVPPLVLKFIKKL